MTSSALGIIALAVSAILYAVAYVLIRQITRVDT
jgi:drug/metabolite transporter (DMT)-like permease